MSNHTEDKCNHTFLQSDHTPMRSNTLDTLAVGTGHTGRSRICILSWTAMTVCFLTAVAAACFLSWERGKKGTLLNFSDGH